MVWTEGLWQRLINGASLIGVVVAGGAAISVYKSAEHSVKAQYVILAVGLLNGPKPQSDVDLRGWATDVVNRYSAVPLPEKLVADLKAGKITLSGAALVGEASDTTQAEGALQGNTNTGSGVPRGREPKSESIPYAEFGAAFFGALAAFILEAFRRYREDRRKDLAAGNQAITVLAQMYSVLRNVNDQAYVGRAKEIREKLNRDALYLEYQPLGIGWNPQTQLPMSRLGFLLKSHDGDILNRLALVERAFLTILDTNLRRNDVHVRFQERARSVLIPGNEMRLQELEDLVGVDLALQLKQLTEHLLSDVPRTRDDLLSLSTQLRGVLDMEFPTGRTVGFKPFDVPYEGVAAPPDAHKAAWWRRVVRAIINKWRGPR